jgi:tetratricopeptide (TPR) repeat protein
LLLIKQTCFINLIVFIQHKNRFMKFICIAAIALSLLYSCNRKIAAAQPSTFQQAYLDSRGNPMLLGLHKKEDLQQVPYKEWFDKNYADYNIDSLSISRLKPLLKDKQFEIFMGTWCGDSKREVPRMYKILEYAGVQPSQIKLVIVDDHDSSYKQSPAHEEKGKQIFRVPDLLLYDGKKEMNRIVEYPVLSLEKDLLAIAKAEPYEPNYKGAAYLLRLSEKQGTTVIMSDKINLAEKLKSLVQHNAELNSLGYVWMSAGEMDKAMMAFELNALLYPADANVYDSLGEINMKLNKKEEAKKYYRKVLELQPANANAVKMLEKLK